MDGLIFHYLRLTLPVALFAELSCHEGWWSRQLSS